MWKRTLLLVIAAVTVPAVALADNFSLLGADDAADLLVSALPAVRGDWMMVSAVAAFALLRRRKR